MNQYTIGTPASVSVTLSDSIPYVKGPQTDNLDSMSDCACSPQPEQSNSGQETGQDPSTSVRTEST